MKKERRNTVYWMGTTIDDIDNSIDDNIIEDDEFSNNGDELCNIFKCDAYINKPYLGDY